MRNLTNQRFGRLTAIKYSGSSRNHGALWLCKCDCGNEKTVASVYLVKNRSKSCGCLKKEKFLRRPFESTYNIMVATAKKRNIECSISYEDYVTFTNITQCHYCNDVIEWYPYRSTKHKQWGYSLDRKDNAVGYTKDNCVVCCKKCNSVKSHFISYDEMLEIGKLLERFRLSKGQTALSE